MSSILSDHPTLNDSLGRDGFVRRVGDLAMNCTPPHVFGVHGDWGSGKTSCLQQIHWYLAGACPEQTKAERDEAGPENDKGYKDRAAVIWFEAWRYQHEEVPVVALLHEIRSQLPLVAKWKGAAMKMAEVSIRSAFISLENVTKKIGIQASKIQEVGEKWERDHLAETLPSHTIRDLLEHSLSQILRKSGTIPRRVIVLIDDLDRCEPLAAYRMLEGIKIYLNLPNCVFILGMDQRVIEEAIAHHAPGIQRPRESGFQDGITSRQQYLAREYMEKLCHDVLHLPIVPGIAENFDTWLANLNHPGLTPEIRDLLKETINQHNCLPANPRKIKGFANVVNQFLDPLQLIEETTDRDEELRRVQLLIVIAYLYHFHNRLYRILESRPIFFEEIVKWVRFRDVPHPALRDLEGTLMPLEDENLPPGDFTLVDAYQDPSRGNVLRVDSVIYALGSATIDEIKALLLRD